MTVTIELSDDIAKRLSDLPANYRRSFAETALRAAFDDIFLDEFAESEHITPLKPFSHFESKAEYIIAASENAIANHINPEVAQGIAEGIADIELGRIVSLDYTSQRIEDALAEIKSKRK